MPEDKPRDEEGKIDLAKLMREAAKEAKERDGKDLRDLLSRVKVEAMHAEQLAERTEEAARRMDGKLSAAEEALHTQLDFSESALYSKAKEVEKELEGKLKEQGKYFAQRLAQQKKELGKQALELQVYFDAQGKKLLERIKEVATTEGSLEQKAKKARAELDTYRRTVQQEVRDGKRDLDTYRRTVQQEAEDAKSRIRKYAIENERAKEKVKRVVDSKLQGVEDTLERAEALVLGKIGWQRGLEAVGLGFGLGVAGSAGIYALIHALS